MNKNNRKTPEEIARELESFDFPEIEEEDLQEAFGGIVSDLADSDCNCGNINCGCA